MTKKSAFLQNEPKFKANLGAGQNSSFRWSGRRAAPSGRRSATPLPLKNFVVRPSQSIACHFIRHSACSVSWMV